MSVRAMKNYDEWPYWHELAEAMARTAVFKIVHCGIYNYGWKESPSAVVDMSREDLVDFAMKQHVAIARMGSNVAAMMSIFGMHGIDIDLSDDSALVVSASGLIDCLVGERPAEPLTSTPADKAYRRMCGYLQNSGSFKALLAFIAEWRGGEAMKSRVYKLGLSETTSSYAYSITESSFKEAYPDSFKKGFWASLFG